jgi:hypothetical protein
MESSKDHDGINHMHTNKLFNMRKSNKEQKSQIPLGGSTLNADEAKFMTSASFKKSINDNNDNNFRLNVSQRRQINRGSSCDSKGDFEFKRNNFSSAVASSRSTFAN